MINNGYDSNIGKNDDNNDAENDNSNNRGNSNSDHVHITLTETLFTCSFWVLTAGPCLSGEQPSWLQVHASRGHVAEESGDLLASVRDA